MVYATIKRQLPEAIPEQLLTQLRANALAGTHGNLVLLREMLRVARQLSTCRIRFAIFKGLTLNQMVYQDLGIRKCGDIDILVGQRDFTRVKDLLLADGFSPTLTDLAEVQYLQSGLWHEQRQVSIDLHWGIPPRELGIRADKILENASGIFIGGQSLPAFSPEDLLIILCVNATKEYWNQLLYPYCDIHEFLSSHPGLNRSALFTRARELRCERMVRTALRVVAALYDMAALGGDNRRTMENDRAAQELILQLFDHRPDEGTFISHRRLLYLFDSTDDYFMTLIDTPLQRLSYRLLHIPLRRFVPEALRADDTPLPRGLDFLRPAARAARICGLILRKGYQKMKQRIG
ncbi:MAG: nucleotidyltransferase family protein [Gammaproteobacteria bacterium]|nr:nucleotidyltransferase family protein [Gammaproteobacteria bacterium]